MRKSRVTSYSNTVATTYGSSAPPGDYTLNAGCDVPLTLMTAKGDKGPLIVRPWPTLSDDDPDHALAPGRMDRGQRGQGLWIVAVPSAVYVGAGSMRVTFHLCHPAGNDVTERKFRSPYMRLYITAKQAAEANKKDPTSGSGWKPAWSYLLDRIGKDSARLSAPTTAYYMLGAVLRNGETNYLAKNGVPYGLGASDPVPVIRLTNHVGFRLMTLLDRLKTGASLNDPGSEAAPFLFGDPVGVYQANVGIRGGLIFYIVDTGKATMPETLMKFSTLSLPAPPADEKKSRVKAEGYEAGIMSNYPGPTPFSGSLSAAHGDLVFRKVRYLIPGETEAFDPAANAVLRFGVIEEQALWVAMAFKDHAPVVAWCWRDYPEYMTDEVRAVLQSRVSAVIPGQGEASDQSTRERAQPDFDQSPPVDDFVTAGAPLDNFGSDEVAPAQEGAELQEIEGAGGLYYDEAGNLYDVEGNLIDGVSLDDDGNPIDSEGLLVFDGAGGFERVAVAETVEVGSGEDPSAEAAFDAGVSPDFGGGSTDDFSTASGTEPTFAQDDFGTDEQDPAPVAAAKPAVAPRVAPRAAPQVKPRLPAKPAAAVKPQPAVKPTAQVKPQVAAKPQPVAAPAKPKPVVPAQAAKPKAVPVAKAKAPPVAVPANAKRAAELAKMQAAKKAAAAVKK